MTLRHKILSQYNRFKQSSKEAIAHRLYLNRQFNNETGNQDDDWQHAGNIFKNPLRLTLFHLNTPFIIGEKKVIEPTDRWLNRLEIFRVFEKLSPVLEAIGVIAIPIVLAIAAQQYRGNLETREEERLQDAKIHQYLNHLSTVLLQVNNDIRDDENERIRTLIRASTLTLLKDENFGGTRKGQVLEFLSEMGLVQGTVNDPETEKNEHQAPIISLRSVDLNDADLGNADLSNADLSSAFLRFADLRKTDLSSAFLRSADLSNANLRSANLRSADLYSANLRSADLHSADLHSADLHSANLHSANLRSANLRSADLSNADLCSADLRSADLRSARLRDAFLCYADLRYTDFSSANLRYANLRYANLSSANLQYADLGNADLGNTNLSSADLSNAKLHSADLLFADLSSANLHSVNLHSADLRSTDLINADLIDADLINADLIDADLINADLIDADLSSADLRFADLRFADLRSAILVATDFRNSDNLTIDQISGDNQPFLCNVALPDHITVDPNRDCNDIPQLLSDRYFVSIKRTQRWVNKEKQKKWD